MLKDILLAFIPLFVAVDAIGILPLYMGLVDGIGNEHKPKIVKQSVLTAFLIAIFFLFLGKTIFGLIGITIQDFMIAGGVLLFIIAITDIISGRKMAREIENIGVVPIGVPLIVGPAVLTTELLLVDIHGIWPTVIALTLNIIIAGVVLKTANFWEKILGKGGSKAFSKIASLFLAAIAVMMVRKGIFQILAKM